MTRAIALSLLALACATPPKPPELDAFERLRGDPSASRAAELSPGLVKEADEHLRRAKDAWETNELEEARVLSLMGWTKLKTAMAILEQARAKERARALELAHEEIEKERMQVDRELAVTEEHVALLQKLKQAKSTVEASAVHQKVTAAELALKTADTVNAAKYASEEYESAGRMLARAREDLKGNDLRAADANAELARQRAEEAVSRARPLWQRAEQDRARDEALVREANSLHGVGVRVERRGDVTRLIIELEGLFNARAVRIRSGQDDLLRSVAELLKKYPTYPLEVIGHTDNRGRRNKLVDLSAKRARAVRDAMVTRGIDGGRFVVSGQGPDTPIADNKTRIGRSRNNRIEMVFLYQ